MPTSDFPSPPLPFLLTSICLCFVALAVRPAEHELRDGHFRFDLFGPARTLGLRLEAGAPTLAPVSPSADADAALGMAAADFALLLYGRVGYDALLEEGLPVGRGRLRARRRLRASVPGNLGLPPSHQGIGLPSRKNPPLGPSAGSVASHTIPSAAWRALSGADGPPMRVRAQPGQAALTFTSPRTSEASFTVRAFSAAFETP